MTGFVVKLERSNYMPAYLRMICMVSQDFPAEYDIYENISFVPVSYTHLTLPTILLV